MRRSYGTTWWGQQRCCCPKACANCCGPSRSLDPLAEADLLITTYGVVRSEGAALARKKWIGELGNAELRELVRLG